MNALTSSIAPGDHMTAPHRVVLHPSHKEGEWVTHVENLQSGGFNWGHYFDDYAEAVADYRERCLRYAVYPNQP